jgi:cell wall-associated NlpC family hydrolase
MSHWARQYIGRPWARGDDGPARFACWGLVRHVFRTRHQVELPAIPAAEHAPWRAIRHAVQTSGWRRVVDALARDWDVVVMRSQASLHCGVVITANGRLGVLHSTHAHGVAWQPWRDAVAGMAWELWRKPE